MYYIYMQSKADVSQLNLQHQTKNQGWQILITDLNHD